MFDRIFAFFRRGNTQKAAQAKTHYEQALAMGEDNDIAILELEQATRLKPDYREAYFALGQVYYRKGNHDRAIDCLNKAIQLKPDDADAYVGRGLAYASKGDAAHAIADYDKALELKPDDCSTYLLRGTAHDKMGEIDLAAADYKRVAEQTGNAELLKKVSDRLRAMGTRPADATPKHATPPPTASFMQLRNSILATTGDAAGFQPTAENPNVWGVLVETGFPDTVATVYVVTDGSANLYLGNGHGVAGSADNPQLAALAKDLISECELWSRGMTGVTIFPLPANGRVRFYIQTFTGVLTAEAGEEELAGGRHSLSPLFRRTQEILTHLRA
ncbi:MAG: tetratricopeptide repeat protein [Dehalococcoidia bacterium]|nr:tetratricopeptide repeat protein [Dehalococcoidia bacterium]